MAVFDLIPPEPPLHRAARVGDHAALRRLLDSSADIETRAIPAFERGTEGLTPLMVAACSVDGASVETLALLLERGADLRATSHSSTAAWYAAGGDGGYENPSDRTTPDRVDRLRYLLDAGLDAREGDDDRRALISQAARVGDPARVRLLLARGASPLGDEWVIPLFEAAASGSAECVRLLLDAGADPNGHDYFGRSALASARSPEVVAVLLAAGAKLDWRNSQEDLLDAVFTAITDADPPFTQGFAVAEALLHAGLSLEKIDSQGWSRLAFAAFREQAAVVEFLLSRGVSLANDNEGSTPLHWVCWQGEHDPEIDAACERIVRRLVVAGISVDARTRRQRTPLHEAVTGDWGNPIAVGTLLALGAEVDSVDYRGRTPLHRAVAHGGTACVETLLQAGANPDHADQEGTTPRDLARRHPAIARLIGSGDWSQSPVAESGPERRARLEAALRVVSAAYASRHAVEAPQVRQAIADLFTRMTGE